MEKISEAIKKAIDFILHDMWDIEVTSLSKAKRFGVGILRVFHLVIRRFRDDKLPVHASALTLGTLIAMVPFFAISFSMAKGLGAGDQLVDELKSRVSVLEEQLASHPPAPVIGSETAPEESTPQMAAGDPPPAKVTDFLNDMITQVEEADFFAIGGVGSLILVIIVIQMLSSIEASFNTVWGIPTSRNLLRKVSNYISTLVIVPVLFLAAGAVTAAFQPLVERWGLGNLYKGMLGLTPYIATWLAFSFLYIFMPNTRVKGAPALISGLIAALLWVGWLRIYIEFQPGVSKTNFIYGTLAAVPIFLAWLYASWLIVLLGAEIAFAIQNQATYKIERGAYGASARAKMLLALAVMLRAASSMGDRKPPFQVIDFAREKGVSIRFLNEMVGLLVRADLLVEMADKPDCYVLRRAPETLTVADVMDVIMEDGSKPTELGLNRLDRNLSSILEAARAGMNKSLSGKTLAELAPRI